MERLVWARFGRVCCAALLFTGGLAVEPELGATHAHAERFDLVVASTTDVHGRIRGWDYYANAADLTHSLAAAATIVDSLRSANPGRVLLVDAGDLLQGNPLTYVVAKVSPQPVHPVIAAMNVMRYDAAVIGNHEFNYGVPHLQAAMAQAGFPFLAANVVTAQGKPFVAPLTIVERRGVHIGIIGATTPGSMVWDRDNLHAAGLMVSDIVPAVRLAVAEARRQKADVIIVLLHAGLDEQSSYDTTSTRLPSENVAARVAREIDGIDLVVYGHSHKELVDSTINGALLVQPRNWAASVGVATLTVEQVKGKWTVVAHRGQSVKVAGHREVTDVVAASAGSHRATIAWVTTPIGRTDVVWRADSARVVDMPITDLVNEVMRREGKADLAATAAFSLDASLDTGRITMAALSKLYPYDNTLRVVRVSGAQVRAFLEHSARYYQTLDASGRAPSGGIVDAAVPGFNFDVLSGADYTINLTKPIGSRITKLEIRGRAIQPTDTFTLALNNYRQGGGGGYAMLAGAPVVYSRDVDIRQLLIDEVKRVGTLMPNAYATRNWTLEPAAAVSLAFAAQTHMIAAAPGTLRVIVMSDFHAALGGRPAADGKLFGGAVALSAAVTRAERECSGDCQSIVVDAGDLFTGSPASDWDAGRPTVAVANRLHIAAGALGNHEFDFGQDTLRQRMADLNYSLLGVNVRGADGRMPTWLHADTIVTRGDVRIGIVGAAGAQTRASSRLRNVRGLEFLDPAPLISARVRALRATGVSVVVSVMHDGARCERERPAECRGSGIDIAARLTDKPDVFVMGHAHENVDVRVAGMPVVQPLSSGRAIVIVDVPLDGGAARTSIRSISADSIAGADPTVDSIVRAAVRKVRARLDQPVAIIAEAMPRHGSQSLGNLVTDAARAIGHADVAAWNTEGLRADLAAGPLVFGGVHEISPFGNVLVRLRISGRELTRVVEHWVTGKTPSVYVSGLLIEVDTTRAAGHRVARITTTNGRVLVPARIYTMIINDFMFDDDEGRTMSHAVSHRILPIRDRDMLATYLRTLPQPVRVSHDARITVTGQRSR